MIKFENRAPHQLTYKLSVCMYLSTYNFLISLVWCNCMPGKFNVKDLYVEHDEKYLIK